VAQGSFLRAFRNLDLLADPAKFGVWSPTHSASRNLPFAHSYRVRDGSSHVSLPTRQKPETWPIDHRPRIH
jgi:hypothetical protein